MKVFVSSLISGFEPLRAAVRSAIRALGHEAVMAEDFAAMPSSPQVACLQGLRSADLVVLVLGERYGAVPTGSAVSPTHEEYLEARDTKPVLLFVQEGVVPEPRQAALLGEAQGWLEGHFRTGFRTPEELRDRVTQAIHRYELSHAAEPLDLRELQAVAEGKLAERSRGGGAARLKLALAAGPRMRVLRPMDLESEDLGDALHQRAMFGSPKIFERSTGVDTRMEGDELVVEQKDGASLRLDEWGALTLAMPIERQSERQRGLGGFVLGIVEESVLRELANAIAFADWILEKIDPTGRLTHVALAVRIEASDFLTWRTQAEQEASPNSATMRMGQAPDKPVCLDRPRGALKFDSKRLAEDVLVPLRRQWRT